MIVYSDKLDAVYSACPVGISCCILKNLTPLSLQTGLTYYEKNSSCSSGLSCYTSSQNTDNYGFDLVSSAVSTVLACVQSCDSNAQCTNFKLTSDGNCFTKWKRLNESLITRAFDSYFRYTNCTPIDQLQVPLLSNKVCKTRVSSGEELVSGEQLCSVNGKHVLTITRNGRISLDGGKWTFGGFSGRLTSLQFTDSYQLLMRMEGGSTNIIADFSDTSSAQGGALMVSDDGLLQIINSNGDPLWNHMAGYIPYMGIRYATKSNAMTASMFIDGNSSTCTNSIPLTAITVKKMATNSFVSVALMGQNLQCSMGLTSVTILREHDGTDPWNINWRYRSCDIINSNMNYCKFRCSCDVSSCETVVVQLASCDQSMAYLCDIFVK